MDTSTRYIVETRVQLQPGKTQEALELFKATNPDLVKDQPDWIRASFSAIEARDIVVVRAEWRDVKSYLAFSESEKFRNTMGEFGKYFNGPPEVEITKVLFEM